jgi:RHS repeat-associated protein
MPPAAFLRQHTGHASILGSTTQVLNASGGLVQSQKYYPYGAARAGNINMTDKEFTGQQQEPDAQLGRYHYGARQYSTVLGRFMSPDLPTGRQVRW